MIPALSVIGRDLATQPRRRLFYVKRTGYVLLASTILIIGSLSMTTSTTAGLKIFTTLSMIALTAMYIIPVFAASDTLLREKSGRTLGLLLMTDLTPAGILTGKLASSLFSTLSYTLAIVPLFILTATLGGVSAPQILNAMALLVSTLFLGVCIGLFAGTVLRTDNNVTFILIFAIIFLYVALPLSIQALHIADHLDQAAADGALLLVSPYMAMRGLGMGSGFQDTFPSCLFAIGCGLPFLLASYAMFPRMIHRHITPPETQTAKRTLPALLGNDPHPPVSRNPVFWREFYIARRGGMRAILRNLIFSALGIALISGIVSYKLESDYMLALNTILISYAIFSLVIFFFGSLFQCTGAFYEDRRDRTLEVLLTTPISPGRIVRGKACAILASFAPWLCAALICGLLLTIINVATTTPWEWFEIYLFAGIMLACAIGVWLAFASLAMWMSVRFKRAVILTTCMIIIFFGSFLYGLVLMFTSWLFGALLLAILDLVGNENFSRTDTLIWVIAPAHLVLMLCFALIFNTSLCNTLRAMALKPGRD